MARNDPIWYRATYARPCARCGRTIAKGEKVFFFPLTGSSYCTAEACGIQADRDFEAARFDETAFGGW